MIRSLKKKQKTKKAAFKLFLKCFFFFFHMTGAVYESVNLSGVPL